MSSPGCAGSTTLVVGGSGGGVARARARCKLGFFRDQWLLLPYQGLGQGLWGWSRNFEEARFLPGVMVVFALVWDVA